MKTHISTDTAEQIRTLHGLTPEAFSIRLGYTRLAYRLARDRGNLSRFMQAEIRRRFWKTLREMEP